MKVAITGNIASGKSALAELWARAGVPMVSADDLARSVVEPGTPGLAAVVEAFGPDVLTTDGTLDRGAMRELAFSDPAVRRRLEGILHPLIAQGREAWMALEEEKGTLMAVAEIPLLFEVGLEGAFDLVVVVDAPVEERIRRVVDLRGLGEEEAKKMVAAQMPAEEKLERADFVVHNSGTMVDLEVRAMALLDLLRARASTKGRGRPEGRA